MTTAADVIRVAEEVRAAGLIYRDPGSGYVSIQQEPPYDDGRFGTGWVEHCGITVAYILTRAGLRLGIDYPSGIQYSPLLARQILTEGFATPEPQPGGIGVVDWGAAGYGQAWASDHVVLIIEPRADTIVVLDANTTDDGKLYYHEYPRAWFTAWGIPLGLTVAPPPPPDPAEIHHQWARRNPPPILLGVQA